MKTDPENGSPAPDGKPREEQPRWRQDFPIDWAQDEYVSRRELVKFMALTSFAFVGGHLWLMIKEMRKKARVAERGAAAVPAAQPSKVATVSEVPIGGAKVFEYPAGSPPRLLVRLEERRFVAYDQQCTHLLCPVLPEPVEGKLHCPCHNGWFDVETGRPLAGPPRRPLPRVTLDIRGEEIYATGVELGEGEGEA